jgi:hypothetical protein
MSVNLRESARGPLPESRICVKFQNSRPKPGVNAYVREIVRLSLSFSTLKTLGESQKESWLRNWHTICFQSRHRTAPRVMDTAPVNEIGRIAYLGNLMALTQAYLEFNFSVTDAILAAESDLVTWKILHPDSYSASSTSGQEMINSACLTSAKSSRRSQSFSR